MAKLAKKPKKVKSQSLLNIARESIIHYGKMTIENRAMPDFRDGMLPVHRRIMWAMFKRGLVPNGASLKSATVVGDVIGEYHPHGDSSVYKALVGLVNSSAPLIKGQGNFGSVFGGDSAAAYRYTECKLTQYAHHFVVNPGYMAIATLLDSFNGRSKEPLFIPSIVPDLLINGTYGIAMGATSIIPPFHPDGVFHLVERSLNGDKITANLCKKHLRINYPDGGHFAGDEESLMAFFKEGRGGLRLHPDYKVDRNKKTITITGVPMGLTLERVVRTLGEHPRVAVNGINNLKEIETVITLKSTVSEKEVNSLAEEMIAKLGYTLASAVGITERINEDDIRLMETNIPTLIDRWVRYRIELEKTYQDHRFATLDEKQKYSELLVLAASNREVIIKALKTDNPADQIAKKLNLTIEQANTILDLQVRRLSKLSENELNHTINELRKQKKEAKAIKNDPKSRIMGLLNLAANDSLILRDGQRATK